MSLDVIALRESFALIVERAPDVSSRFYDVFFARHPEVRALFGRNSRQKQEEMLTKALIAVVDHLEDPTWLGGTLEALGAKHVGYKVTEEMYGWVGECLLITLSDVLAEEWTARVAKAWTNAYGAISGAMIEGARAEIESWATSPDRSPPSSQASGASLA
jgi:hemoglobin-like flavoprotein